MLRCQCTDRLCPFCVRILNVLSLVENCPMELDLLELIDIVSDHTVCGHDHIVGVNCLLKLVTSLTVGAVVDIHIKCRCKVVGFVFPVPDDREWCDDQCRVRLLVIVSFREQLSEYLYSLAESH